MPPAQWKQLTRGRPTARTARAATQENEENMMRLFTLLPALALCAAGTVQAQSRITELPSGYPSKPVKILVGNPPGGGVDTIARMVATQLTERWGKAVIVENMAGATGQLAMNALAKGDPDGHLMLLGGSQLVISTVLKKIPFDIRKAYAPVVQLTSQPYMLVVHPGVAARSVKELIASARSKPGSLNYGTTGVGSLAHLGLALFEQMAKIKMQHIPYKGGGPALADLAGGRIHLFMGTAVSVNPLIRAGKIRVLAVTSTERSSSQPDVPTIDESGLKDYNLGNAYGLHAPAKTPPAIVSAINLHSNLVIRTPEFASRLAADGVEAAAPNTPSEFRNIIERDVARWEKFFKTPGLDVESFK
jgi:tripartite-type tricarboxylate transporter receptor subunit TctC